LSACDNYLGKTKILPIQPTLFSLLFLISLVCGVVVTDIISRPRFILIAKVLKSNTAIIIPFFMIVFFSLLGALHPTAYWGSGGTWIYLNTYNFVILLLAMLTPTIPFLNRNFRTIVLAGLLLGAWAIGSDVMAPGTFSVERNRPAGFSGNSNWGALSMVMMTAGALSFSSRKMRLDFFIIAISGWAILSTLSRSGSMNFFILVASYIYLSYFTGRGDARKGIFILSGVASVMFAFLTFTIFETENDDIDVGSQSKSRLKGFLQGELVDDGSSASRKGAALHALNLMEEAPIFGHGTGFSRTMPEKPHNLFLNQGVNNGFLGLASYLFLLVASFYHFYRYRYSSGMAFVGVILIGSFFSHNILEQRTFLLILGYMSTAAWYNQRVNTDTRDPQFVYHR